MDRDTAIRADARVHAIGVSLSSLADYIRGHMPAGPKRKELILCVGKSMGELVELSNKFYEMYPDIKPRSLSRDTNIRIKLVR
jgi:hypothetical protein